HRRPLQILAKDRRILLDRALDISEDQIGGSLRRLITKRCNKLVPPFRDDFLLRLNLRNFVMQTPEKPISVPGNDTASRRQLMALTQGRRLDEAYCHREIRDAMVAEAAKAPTDKNALVTPDMLAQLDEYMEAMEGAGVAPGVLTTEPTATTRAFFSTDA